MAGQDSFMACGGWAAASRHSAARSTRRRHRGVRWFPERLRRCGRGGRAGGIDEAAELEASAGAEEGAHLGGELLLPVDPFGISGGGKGVHRLLAEFALAAAAHDLAQAVELKRSGAGVKERGGHENLIIAERTRSERELRLVGSKVIC